ncbi:hypothetical protein [Legionella quateirensis]|uniref:hypothetical protein n=1 Tax=Legionella quateirensis TaxID=45072 RepID=UPI0010552B7A|nr:hypothetical protein [Legionella quateirensis]
MSVLLHHSILAISSVMFTIGIIMLILANGSSGNTMRRMGLFLSGFSLIAFTLFFFLDVLQVNT